MRKAWTLFLLLVLVAGTGVLVSARDASAAFHIMRVYNVMGGANGSTSIQFVELRMADPGQNFVSTHDICFFDASGAPYARFTFSSNVASGADEASVLVGTSEFDSAWAAGSPDFTFSARLETRRPSPVARTYCTRCGHRRVRWCSAAIRLPCPHRCAQGCSA
jgi:hypothetical protein